MVLIDALNLHSEGGNGLLVYLIKLLEKHQIEYRLEKMKSVKTRQRFFLPFYRKRILSAAITKYQPKCILCFGNFPLNFTAPQGIKIIVNFQNAFLLKGSDESVFSGLKKMKFFLRRNYLRRHKKNADLYIFPTHFIQNEFIKTYSIAEEKAMTIPYFDKGEILEAANRNRDTLKKKSSFIYISSSSKHKNHQRLLAVWEKLTEQQLYPRLTLSIPLKDQRAVSILAIIQRLRQKGADIVNVNDRGYIPYSEILDITAQHEFTIYPTLCETFGFGTIEGVMLGNKLLVSDRPFVDEVTQPSLRFDPHQVEDMYEKVVHALNHPLPPSKLLFEDRIEEFVDQLR